MKGDVFQRDQRYYDQMIGTTRRNRSPNRSGYPIDNNNLNNSMRANQVLPNTLSLPITTNSGTIITPPPPMNPTNMQTNPNQIIVTPPQPPSPPIQNTMQPPMPPIVDLDELRRLRE